MLAPTPVRYSGVVHQPFRPDSVAPLRRSVAMLRPHDPAGLDRSLRLSMDVSDVSSSGARER